MRAFLIACLLPITAAAADGYVRVPGGDIKTTLAYEDVRGPMRVPPFEMMTRLVTNAEFRAFVQRHPQWRRDRVPEVLAGPGYLAHWPGALQLTPSAQEAQPVTRVSWFAARAYCEAQGARLPAWQVPAGKVAQVWALPRAADGGDLPPIPLGVAQPAKPPGSTHFDLPASSEQLLSNVPRLAVSFEDRPAVADQTPTQFVFSGFCVKLW